MRTVTFKSVLHGAAQMVGMDPTRGDFNNAVAAAMTEYVNNRIRQGWEQEVWPEWTLIEQRSFRASYASGTAYAAPTASVPVEVFFIAAQKYYQALRATTGNAPATLVAGEYVENSAYWAECASSYSANDWTTGMVFAVGDQARNPDDNRFYQCHTAHTAGAGFDATKFGILTPFDRYVDYDQSGLTPIGQVLGARGRDPRVYSNSYQPVRFALSERGVQFAESAPVQVWLKFRKRPPVFTSSAWVSTTAYVADDLVYYATTGECYKALQASTGQLPTNTTYWERVKFPALLSNFVKRSVMADRLRDLKQTDRAAIEEDRAFAELANAADREVQGQNERIEVMTYGT
jgi:hypothetical protein